MLNQTPTIFSKKRLETYQIEVIMSKADYDKVEADYKVE